MTRGEAKALLKESRQVAKKAGVSGDAANELQTLQQALQEALAAKEGWQEPASALENHLDTHFAKWRKGRTREYFESIFIAVLAALLLRAFVVEAFQIPTGSMEPTLLVGDHLFVAKYAYGVRVPFTTRYLWQWGDVERGDIVVFEFPVPEVATQFTIGEATRILDAYRMRNGGYPATIREAGLDPAAMVDGWGQPLRYGLVGSEARLTSAGPDGEFGSVDDLDNTNSALQGGAIECLPFDALDSAKDYIKRVIGLPGDRVSMRGGVIYVNDQPIERSEPLDRDERVHGRPVVATLEQMQGGPSYETWAIGMSPNFDEVVVREGHLLMIGDNRDNSSDGRCWGQVPMENVKGRALFIFYSRDRRAASAGGSSGFSSIRWNRFFDRIE